MQSERGGPQLRNRIPRGPGVSRPRILTGGRPQNTGVGSEALFQPPEHPILPNLLLWDNRAFVLVRLSSFSDPRRRIWRAFSKFPECDIAIGRPPPCGKNGKLERPSG